MLDDLSQHLTDIAENSTSAGARNIDVRCAFRTDEGWRTLEVTDDGRGMDEATCRQVLDPFVTSRTTRCVGLGLPFLKQAAELADGKLALASEPGRGTRLYVCFRADHIDCPPVGDMPLAVATLLAGHPGVRWRFAFGVGQAWFHLDSAEILEILEDPQLLRTPPVSRWLREHLEEGLRELQSGGDTGAQNFES